MHLLRGYEDQRSYRQSREKKFAVCDLSLLQALLLTAQELGFRSTTPLQTRANGLLVLRHRTPVLRAGHRNLGEMTKVDDALAYLVQIDD